MADLKCQSSKQIAVAPTLINRNDKGQTASVSLRNVYIIQALIPGYTIQAGAEQALKSAPPGSVSNQLVPSPFPVPIERQTRVVPAV